MLLLGVTGHPLTAGLLGLASIGYELFLLDWIVVAASRDALAAQAARRGHPDEERSVTRARWSLAARGDRP